jgi:hypothetical protein
VPAIVSASGAVSHPEDAERRRKTRATAWASAYSGDWLWVVLTHHEAIERAFADVKTAGDGLLRQSAQKRLGWLLTGHSIAEEAVIYPALAQAWNPGHAKTAYAEQAATKVQIAALKYLDPMSQAYVDVLARLEVAVLDHMYEEEQTGLSPCMNKRPWRIRNGSPSAMLKSSIDT